MSGFVHVPDEDFPNGFYRASAGNNGWAAGGEV